MSGEVAKTTEQSPVYHGSCTNLPDNVALEDVVEYIILVKALNRDTVFDGKDSGLAKPSHTPFFFYKNVAVKYYVDTKKKEGVDLQVTDSDWGPFVQIPDEC